MRRQLFVYTLWHNDSLIGIVSNEKLAREWLSSLPENRDEVRYGWNKHEVTTSPRK